jgi:hypothetical protein
MLDDGALVYVLQSVLCHESQWSRRKQVSHVGRIQPLMLLRSTLSGERPGRRAAPTAGAA